MQQTCRLSERDGNITDLRDAIAQTFFDRGDVTKAKIEKLRRLTMSATNRLATQRSEICCRPAMALQRCTRDPDRSNCFDRRNFRPQTQLIRNRTATRGRRAALTAPRTKRRPRLRRSRVHGMAEKLFPPNMLSAQLSGAFLPSRQAHNMQLPRPATLCHGFREDADSVGHWHTQGDDANPLVFGLASVSLSRASMFSSSGALLFF